jgi:protein gp37
MKRYAISKNRDTGKFELQEYEAGGDFQVVGTYSTRQEAVRAKGRSMGDKTKIEWTDASWTPIRARNLKTGKIGWHCEHDTTGCINCYAESMNRFVGTGLPFKPGHRKDIEIFLDEKMLELPLHWRRKRMIFVCSMTDLFADFVSDEWIDRIFTVMAMAKNHTFQVLTKRADRMKAYCTNLALGKRNIRFGDNHIDWPLPNVWLGVSAERQVEADERIPLLLQTTAAVRFVSVEPMLGPIDLTRLGVRSHHSWPENVLIKHLDYLDWVIVGGESGPHARPMDPAWAASIRDQCKAAGVAFFMKQMTRKTPIPSELLVREMPV